MAKRARKRRRPARPGVILNPDVADDDDDSPAKSSGESPSGSGLIAAVRANLVNRKPGFRPWYERIAPEHLAELEELRAEWRAGRLGSQLRPVAVEVVAYMQANRIGDIGVQGVVKWLAHRD